MARADLLCELIKYGLLNDPTNFKKAAEALCAEERAKQHTILANKIEEILFIYLKSDSPTLKFFELVSTVIIIPILLSWLTGLKSKAEKKHR